MLGFSAVSEGPVSYSAPAQSGDPVASTLVYADLAGSYAVMALVGADLAATYSIGAAGSLVSADLAATYEIKALVSADLAGSYAIGAIVGANLQGYYAIESNTTFARAPVGDGYRPRAGSKQLRPPAIQGYSR